MAEVALAQVLPDASDEGRLAAAGKQAQLGDAAGPGQAMSASHLAPKIST